MLIAVELVSALVLLVLASDAFTNAVEWVGAKTGLAHSAVGAVVAAIGSSLPETMVAFVALVLLRDAASLQVGIGAVIGAPFMLATAVLCLIGLTAMMRRPLRDEKLTASMSSMTFGLVLFSFTFAVVIGASFAPTLPVRIAASAIVLGSYAAYLWYHLRARAVEEQRPRSLRFAPRASSPATILVWLQLVVALIVTLLASRWFVMSVSRAAETIGAAPLLVSLILSPIATEIPEAMNATLWMRRRLDELALGNVVGAMMFQTSVASALAMLVTPWQLNRDVYAAAAATFAAVAVVVVGSLYRRSVSARALAACGLFYVAYLAYVFLR
jgi:cation:H+ antiporter